MTATQDSIAIEIEVEDLASMRLEKQKLMILDVREEWETRICAIEGSVNVPLSSLPENQDRLPADRPVIVVCHHGARSMRAVAWLRQNGIANATNLRGGIDAWARRVDPRMATY